jgi:hypothetical protein
LVVGYSGETACSALENKDCNVLRTDFIYCVKSHCNSQAKTLRGVTFASLKEVSMPGVAGYRGKVNAGSALVHHGFSHDHPSIP